MRWSDAKKIIENNPQVAYELVQNETEYKLIAELISRRKELNLTQKELAELIGTKQSNIARLESGNYNPTIKFLQRIFSAMGRNLSFSIQ